MAAASENRRGCWRRGPKSSRSTPTGSDRLDLELDPQSSVTTTYTDAESSNRHQGGRGTVSGCRRLRATKLQLGHCANPASLEAWKGYEWAKALDEGAMYATKENAAMMAKYIKEHASDGPSCLFLSLLAFSTKPMDFFQRRWGEVELDKVDGIIGQFAREARIAITVYFLGKDGRITGQGVFGRGSEHGGAVVIIPSGNGAIHALPLAKPTRLPIVVPPLVLRDIVGDPEPGAEVAATAEMPEPSVNRKAEVAKPSAPVQMVHSTPAVPTRVGPFHWPPKGGKYVGPSPPPPWFNGEWVAGFMAKERRDVSMIRQWLYTSVVRPDLAAASLGNFHKFGTAVYYSDVTLGPTVTRIGRRRFTDGHFEDDFFTVGDRLTADGYDWDVLRVTWDGHPVLVVKPCSISTTIFGEPANAKVEPALGSVDPGELFKARCTAMRLTRTDPVETALATRWMGDWAASGYDVSGDPDDVATVALAVARQYRSVGSVGGGYGWGLCYSCGGQLTGKSRICCRGVNSPLAVMIAAGEKVTSMANRILYPGVVWNTSQHPPLKAGVETVATNLNFR